MVTCGIDTGSKTIKVVIMEDNKILGQTMIMTGRDKEELAEKAFDEALQKAGLSRQDVKQTIATGIGRKRVTFANDTITAPSADAKGIIWCLPSVRTVIDVGAEEGRAIRCDEKGTLKDFATNEKCAAGAGTFVEVTARTMEVKLEQMGELSLQSTQKVDMNAQCAVFAESELVSLIHRKLPKVDIIRSVHEAMAGRIDSLARTIEVEKDVALVGGVAHNIGFLDCLKRSLEVDISVPEDPEFVGAIGAAIIAATGGAAAVEEVAGKVVAKDE
ncbi:acyl-CoA dehydratase activase [Chloroflexota bacterium]